MGMQDNNNYAKIATKLTNSIYQIKLHTKSLVDKIEFRLVTFLVTILCCVFMKNH